MKTFYLPPDHKKFIYDQVREEFKIMSGSIPNFVLHVYGGSAIRELFKDGGLTVHTNPNLKDYDIDLYYQHACTHMRFLPYRIVNER